MPDTGLLETFPNPFPNRAYTIEHIQPEYTSVCPKTGHPDFGIIEIAYVPRATCLELKALKYYLGSFRDEGHFYEAVVNVILEDLVAACAPRQMTVRGRFNPRGGMTSTIEATTD